MHLIPKSLIPSKHVKQPVFCQVWKLVRLKCTRCECLRQSCSISMQPMRVILNWPFGTILYLLHAFVPSRWRWEWYTTRSCASSSRRWRGAARDLNGAPIRVSGAAELGAALLVTEVGVARDDETVVAIFGRVGALTKEARPPSH